MQCRITMTEFNADWYIIEGITQPRQHAGLYSREEAIALCGTLDVDGLELMGQYWDDCSPAYVRRVAEDAGLPLISYIFFVDLALPPESRAAAIDEAYAHIDRFAEMGASLGMIIPGVGKEDWPVERQRAWMVEGLRDCAERAHSVGVTLISENVDYPPSRPLMGRGTDCRDICAQVDSPGFRLIYDSCASLCVGEDPLETLRVMAPHIAHVHIKNGRPLQPYEPGVRFFEADDGQRYTGTDIDAGVVDLPPILAELEQLGYDGYMMIEYQGLEEPTAALPRSVATLRRLLAET